MGECNCSSLFTLQAADMVAGKQRSGGDNLQPARSSNIHKTSSNSKPGFYLICPELTSHEQRNVGVQIVAAGA
jgi:hypothetical protein